MNSNTISAIGGGISMQQSQQQSHQVPPNTIGKPPSLPQMLNPSLHQQMQNQQDRNRQPTVSIYFLVFENCLFFSLLRDSIEKFNHIFFFISFLRSISCRTIWVSVRTWIMVAWIAIVEWPQCKCRHRCKAAVVVSTITCINQALI